MTNQNIYDAMTIKLPDELPEYPEFVEGIRRAPSRGFRLTPAQTKVALKNALRYVPEHLHEKLAPEFLNELYTYGRIYAYRYRPAGRIYGKPIDECYPIPPANADHEFDTTSKFSFPDRPLTDVEVGRLDMICKVWGLYKYRHPEVRAGEYDWNYQLFRMLPSEL